MMNGSIVSYKFLTSSVDGVHAPAALTPGKEPLRYSLDRRLGGPQSRSRRRGEEKILDPTRTRTPAPRSFSPYFFFFKLAAWDFGYCGHLLAYCTSPGWQVRVIVVKLVEWTLTGETQVLGENLPQRHFVHHKPHMTRHGVQPVDNSYFDSTIPAHGEWGFLIIRKRAQDESLVCTIILFTVNTVVGVFFSGL
jgi:hypothetical protein